ncbi:Uncharacterized protein APZ42_028995 [Daphnia magna]|uniref:Reverse transcriptase domain-containing protein n=1 Tax=Daphnia magna TaxID=35525 RepID=A0A164PZX0_9CRUS|nr:Uncharacterized protein APZ42_028995 [Daphnia magna]
MINSLPPAEAKGLRYVFVPVYESSFQLQCPRLDESMGHTLKRLKSSSGSVADLVEKTWLSTCYKIFDIAHPLIQLWGLLPPDDILNQSGRRESKIAKIGRNGGSHRRLTRYSFRGSRGAQQQTSYGSQQLYTSSAFFQPARGSGNSQRSGHFKMEGVESLKQLICQDDWVVKLDLKDAYLAVPVRKEHQLFLSPRFFTKLLKPVVASLRRKGIRLVIYLDDLIIMSSSREDNFRDLATAIDLITSAGFLINWDKSILSLTQSIEFLGLLFYSITLSLALLPEKVRTIVICNDFIIFHSKRSDVSQVVSLPLEVREDISWFLQNLSLSKGLCFLTKEPVNLERSASQICVLDTTAGCICDKRLFTPLETHSGVCVFPVFPSSPLSGEGPEKASQIGVNLSPMDQSALVPTPATPGQRHSRVILFRTDLLLSSKGEPHPLTSDNSLILTAWSHSGKAYPTISIHRSMLSVTLPSVDCLSLGQHLEVKQLMKGCFNSHPPAPKYSSMWEFFYQYASYLLVN